MEEQEVKRITSEAITDYMENISPALEEVLRRFDEIRPGNTPPKFLQKFHTLMEARTARWQSEANPDKRTLTADTLNECMEWQVASFLHGNPKAAATVEKSKNLTAFASPAPTQQPAEAAEVKAPAISAAPAAARESKEKGKGLKALQNVVKAGGAVLSAFFSYQPPKIVTDVSNLTEFALGVIFGTAKGTIQKLREEAKLSQNFQSIKNEVTNGYLADISPKLGKVLERYDDILSTPGDHPALTELNTSIADKMQKWTAGKTAEEQQFASKTFSTLLHSQTATVLAKNPTLAQRISEDRTLLQSFGVPAEAIHPSITVPEKPKELTPELAEKMVKEDGNNLKSVPEQLVTENLCKLAISGENGKGEALKHVPDSLKSPEICDAAMKHNPAQAFLYVPDKLKTPEMCDKAVIATGENLQHVPKDKISRPLCETAIRNFSKSFSYVPKDMRDAALCLTAVKVDGANLRHVPENLKTKKLCTEAQKNTAQDIAQFLPQKFAAPEKAKPSQELQMAIAQTHTQLQTRVNANAIAQQPNTGMRVA
jgi:hypothetical protein